MSSILAMFVQYVAQLLASMKETTIENSKLLNGMHEGLLILSRSEPHETSFCNNYAEKLLKGVVRYFASQQEPDVSARSAQEAASEALADDESHGCSMFDESLTTRCMFIPIKLA